MAIFPFTPSQTAQFQFQPTLDNEVYSATVPWSLFGARFYLSLTALQGALVWYGAVVGSPPSLSIESLSWANGIVSVQTAVPHGFKPASTISLTIDGCTPSAYNGLVAAMITGADTFSYLLASNPGAATVLGIADYRLNLLGGVPNENGDYFSSTLLFRPSANQFETYP